MNIRIKLLLTCAMALAASGSALATDGASLAKEKRCFACHDVSAENFGPAFKDIARRFAGLQNAKRMLAREVQTGTYAPGQLHHWGTMKMPKDTDRGAPVSQAEAEQLVDYILSLK